MAQMVPYIILKCYNCTSKLKCANTACVCQRNTLLSPAGSSMHIYVSETGCLWLMFSLGACSRPGAYANLLWMHPGATTFIYFLLIPGETWSLEIYVLYSKVSIVFRWFWLIEIIHVIYRGKIHAPKMTNLAYVLLRHTVFLFLLNMEVLSNL